MAVMCPFLGAATISGTVRDPSGAVVSGAAVGISGNGQTPIVLTSDARGTFASADLPAGTYAVKVRRDGFEELSKAIDLGTTSAVIELKLSLLARRQEVTVVGPCS